MRGIFILFILFLLISPLVNYAQTCSGSLGDPIINIDFGAGANKYGPSINTTNYSYVSATPTDGSYTIANTTSGMYSTWYAKTDHTGNTNGYMMVINASNTAGEFYRQTINSLCPGTTYEFAAWVLNLLIPNDNKPNITFNITSVTTGQVLKSYTTGDIANGNPNWIQYGMLFTTPAGGGDIVLTMINNGPGGNGNDLALDDITFRPCGPVLTSNFSISANSNLNSCAGTNQSYTMTAQALAGYAVPMYQWQINKNGTWTDIAGAITTTYTANFTPAVAGTYQYRMTSANGTNINSPTCRVVSNVLTLTVLSPPVPTTPPNTAVCEGEILALNPSVNTSLGETFSWTGPNGFTSSLPNPIFNSAQLSNAGTYNVVVTSKANCTASATVKVTVNPKIVLTISNNATICAGNGIQLQAIANSNNIKYTWLPATNLFEPNTNTPNNTVANVVARPDSTITYTVTATNTLTGCSASTSVTITVLQLPNVNAGADKDITEGQTVKLNGSVEPGLPYFWTPATGLSDPNSLTPTATPTQDITYTLHARGGPPCNLENTDQVFIRVYKKIVIPNAFTPNNDGINDTWGIVALITHPESLTQVFNRYGQVVYQNQGYSQAWNGTSNGQPLPEGTYYYKIDLKNGTIFSGWVAIIR
jgi:gliding motility-associated-like protein